MKIKVYKLKKDYKMFKIGALFQEIDGKYVVSTEFARCIDRSFFNDIKLNTKFEELLEKSEPMELKDTLFFTYNVRSLENQVRFATDKLAAVAKTLDEFIKKYK